MTDSTKQDIIFDADKVETEIPKDTPTTIKQTESSENVQVKNTEEVNEKMIALALDHSSHQKTGIIPLLRIDFANIKRNKLSPRQQEEYDVDMFKGIRLLFNNKFSEARAVFETKAKEDPLYALGLSFMSFIRAISSFHPKDAESAITKLSETYLFADGQVQAASSAKPIKETVSDYITNWMGSNPTHLPTNTRPLKRYELMEQEFTSNGALRAHIVKAESALMRAVLYLSLDTMVGYLKAGINLRKAYTSYSFVWLQYKHMGQNYNKYMDKDTISGIQFGIGSVHLLLSTLPPRILKIVSAFGWSADRQLAFALLKLCQEGQGIRSPLASLVILSYYVTIASQAPQILTRELIQPAIECLVEAQQDYPDSAFFLFFAGRISRLTRNLSLSSQSFVYMHQTTQYDWFDISRITLFEQALNAAMSLDWTQTADLLLSLQKHFQSPAYLHYFYGACLEMLGQRTEAILAFAQSPRLIDSRRVSEAEGFVRHRVEFFEKSGYQDIQFSLPVLEVLLMANVFVSMEQSALEKILVVVEDTLVSLYERERMEYDVRMVQLVPGAPKPDYYDQRGTLLLIKASVLNALGRFEQGVVHLNWIIDNKDAFKRTNWVVPFAYWECGNTFWGLKDYKRARELWESTMTHTGYDFEFKLATVSLHDFFYFYNCVIRD
ncbi:unnamed protein product [Rhizopus stolonifer]